MEALTVLTREPNTRLERWMLKVVFDGGCWIWTGAKRGPKRAYGHVSRDGQFLSAHRAVWEEFYGPVPDGKELDHICKRSLCVNPLHQEVVTHRENLLRGDSPAGKRARQVVCIRGHVLNDAHRDNLGRRVCRPCAAARQRVRRQQESGVREPNCLICKHASVGDTTICPFYGPVLDERLDAQGCWFFVDDPSAT